MYEAGEDLKQSSNNKTTDSWNIKTMQDARVHGCKLGRYVFRDRSDMPTSGFFMFYGVLVEI